MIRELQVWGCGKRFTAYRVGRNDVKEIKHISSDWYIIKFEDLEGHVDVRGTWQYIVTNEENKK